MSHKTTASVAHTIGIDTGKNTLHLIGLDDKGAIVLREKIAHGRIAARLANVPRCLIGIEKIENHCHALALYFVFYNFCRVHKTLGATPAMAAGLVDKVLKMTGVVALIDAREVPAVRGPYKKKTAEISN